MVQANPNIDRPPAGSNTRKVRPIPIGEDHLQFKHDPQIQGQLDHNGKSNQWARVRLEYFYDNSWYWTDWKEREVTVLYDELDVSNMVICFLLEHIVFSCQVLKYNRFGMK